MFIASSPTPRTIYRDGVDEWCKIHNSTLHELAKRYHAFIIRSHHDKHHVDFVKSRDPALVIAWCHAQWGEPGTDQIWINTRPHHYLPYLIVHHDENIQLFQITWS